MQTNDTYRPQKFDIWVQHEKDCNAKDVPEEQRGFYLDSRLCGCKEIIWHQFDGEKWTANPELEYQYKRMLAWEDWSKTVDSAKIIRENYDDPSNPKKDSNGNIEQDDSTHNVDI